MKRTLSLIIHSLLDNCRYIGWRGAQASGLLKLLEQGEAAPLQSDGRVVVHGDCDSAPAAAVMPHGRREGVL